MNPKRIYFAGKISFGFGLPLDHWRQPFTGKVEYQGDSQNAPKVDHEFEIEPGFIYCGPFFNGQHGCGTGDEHGTFDTWSEIACRCREQISSCDAVLAWLDGMEAHGTLLEIGFADALGKPVYIGFEAGEFADLHFDEFKFVREFGRLPDIYSDATELFGLMKMNLRGGVPPRITRKRKFICLPGAIVDPLDCFVYLIREVPSGRLKIGTTQDITQRLGQLQVGNPDPLEVVAWYRGSFDEESRLKQRWKSQGIHGEWFNPSTEIFHHYYSRHNIDKRDEEAAAWKDPFVPAETAEDVF